MDRKDFSNLGEDIKEIVANAVNSMDFGKLSQDIRKTTKDALDEVKAGLEAGKNTMRNGQWRRGYGPENYQGQDAAYPPPGYQGQKGTYPPPGYQGQKGAYPPPGFQGQREAYPPPGFQGQRGTYPPPNHQGQRGAYPPPGYQGQRGAYPPPGYQRQKTTPPPNYQRQKAASFSNNNDREKNAVLHKNQEYLARHPAGAVSGIIMIIFGSIFGTGFGISAFVMFCLIAASGFQSIFWVLLLSFFLASIVSFAFVFRGSSQLRRIRRFWQYVRILGNRTFCSLDELATQTDRDRKFIIEDTQKMIASGMFLQGHLDDQKTCLMVTDDIYQQYRIAQNEYRKREEQERKKASEEEARMAAEKSDSQKTKTAENKKNKTHGNSIYDNEEIDKELLNAYQDGKRYLDEISKINQEIPNSEISQKITHMEVVVRRIFRQVQSHPEQLAEIRRFMEYYLPTTLKLVTAYHEFDGQPVQGETITKAKHEIEETLDTINEAYEKLLDSLFEAAALDISTDISVMNAMFAQEGLNKDSFDIEK